MKFGIEKYKAYLGIDVPDDNHGILQDIHWAHGSMGYFPTYSLGSFYAAQFFNQAKKDIPRPKRSNREMETLLSFWAGFRENIHKYGMTYNAGELMSKK